MFVGLNLLFKNICNVWQGQAIAMSSECQHCSPCSIHIQKKIDFIRKNHFKIFELNVSYRKLVHILYSMFDQFNMQENVVYFISAP